MANSPTRAFLQKQDVELQWIRNAMRAVSLQLAIRPCGEFASGFPFVYANWIGDDHPTSRLGQMSYYRERLQKLERGMRVSELIDGGLLLSGLVLALTFAVDVALGDATRFCRGTFATPCYGPLRWFPFTPRFSRSI